MSKLSGVVDELHVGSKECRVADETAGEVRLVDIVVTEIHEREGGAPAGAARHFVLDTNGEPPLLVQSCSALITCARN